MKPAYIILLFLFWGIVSLKAQDTNASDSIKAYKTTQIEVEADKEAPEIKGSKFSAYKIEKSDFTNPGTVTLLSQLNSKAPSLFITQRGPESFGIAAGSAGKISIRGVGGNQQNLIIVDGHPEYAGIFGHPLSDSYVGNNTESVEVISGPASILWGQGAMGGAIEIRTKSNLAFNGYSTNLQYNATDYNSHFIGLNEAIKSGNISGKINYGYFTTNGFRPNSASDNHNFSGNIKWHISDQFGLELAGNYAKIFANDPGTIYAPNKQDSSWTDVMRANTNLTLKNDFGFMHGYISAFYYFGVHDIVNGFHSDDLLGGTAIRQSFKLLESYNITTGFEYNHMGGTANMLNTGLIDTTQDLAAFYILANRNLFNLLDLTVGWRHTYNNYFGAIDIPYGGINIKMNDALQINLSYSEGFRIPTIAELFINTMPPLQPYTGANPDLKPEQSRCYEFGAEYTAFEGKFFTKLSVYKLEGSNLIVKTGVPPNQKNMNTGNFDNIGLEFSLHANPFDNIFIKYSYSQIDFEKEIIGSPRVQAMLELKYTSSDFNAGLLAQDVERLPLATDKSGIVNITTSYTTFDFNASYRIFDALKLGFALYNIFDNGYMINYGYPMPGRYGALSIEVSLSKKSK